MFRTGAKIYLAKKHFGVRCTLTLFYVTNSHGTCRSWREDGLKFNKQVILQLYYMASSASGQDEPNPTL